MERKSGPLKWESVYFKYHKYNKQQLPILDNHKNELFFQRSKSPGITH